LANEVVDRLEKALDKYETVAEKLREARERAIHKYEPERCCPNCDYIADRGEKHIACDPDSWQKN
jgi:hypothetical protein